MHSDPHTMVSVCPCIHTYLHYIQQALPCHIALLRQKLCPHPAHHVYVYSCFFCLVGQGCDRKSYS